MTNGEPKLPENLDAVPLTLNLRGILPALEAALDNLAKISQEGDPLIKGTKGVSNEMVTVNAESLMAIFQRLDLLGKDLLLVENYLKAAVDKIYPNSFDYLLQFMSDEARKKDELESP